MEKLKTLEQTTCFIKLQADSKIEIFESRIGKNRFGAYDLRKFLFKTVTFPGKTFWKGYLKPGIPNQLGVKLEITITEIRQDSTNCYCYGITIQMSLKEEKKNSEYALKLFGMDDKPGKKSKKKRGGKL
jgi:hypothetical protein